MKNPKKTALIFGITGQDGSYLAKLMLDKGFRVFGTSRDIISADTSNLEKLGILGEVELITTCLTDFRSILLTLEKTNPSYVFHLAGQTSVGLSFSLPYEAIDSILVSTLNILECIRFFNKKIKIFIPCSTDCFGASTPNNPSNEESIHMPRSPYAVAKSSCYWLSMTYKNSYDMFISVGFLSNHESPLRGEHFVTSKIFKGINKIKKGELQTLSFGNLEICRDWGWAPSYVDAISKIMDLEKPDNFVIATGFSCSLKKLIDRAFVLSGLGDSSKFINQSQESFRPNEISASYLDPSKAKSILNWSHDISLDGLIQKLLDQELF